MAQPPALRPDAQIGPSLIAIAQDMLGAVSAAGKLTSDVEAVHDVRRALKRWRAFLRLLEPFLGEDGLRMRNEARDLAHSLAGARDAQATLDALSDLGKDYAVLSPRSLAAVTGRVERRRAKAEAALLDAAARERLQAQIARTATAVEAWPVGNLAFQDISARLTAGYRRARNAVPPDWTSADAPALHRLRQRVVAHRHQMELVERLWPRLNRIWIGEAQRLRERLGYHQDLDVLGHLLGPHQPLARWRSRLTPVIAARQKDHIEAAMRHAGRLFAEKPGAFQRRLESLWAAQPT